MMVLNYHKVDDTDDGDFYTVSPSSLAEHLSEIRAQGKRVIGADELLAA